MSDATILRYARAPAAQLRPWPCLQQDDVSAFTYCACLLSHRLSVLGDHVVCVLVLSRPAPARAAPLALSGRFPLEPLQRPCATAHVWSTTDAAELWDALVWHHASTPLQLASAPSLLLRTLSAANTARRTFALPCLPLRVTFGSCMWLSSFLCLLCARVEPVANVGALWRAVATQATRPCFSAVWYNRMAHFLNEACLQHVSFAVVHVRPLLESPAFRAAQWTSAAFRDLRTFFLQVVAESRSTSVCFEIAGAHHRQPQQHVPPARALPACVLGQHL